MYQDGRAANGVLVQREQHRFLRPGLQSNTGLGDYVDMDGQDASGLDGRFRERQANDETAVTRQTPAYISLWYDNVSEQATEGSSAVQSNAAPEPLSLGFDDEFHSTYDDVGDTGSDLLLANIDPMAYDTEFGTNLGFGIEHDWSNGLQLDLFDGFFFGGNGTN
ncbi:MAG: hypothetical protein L6R42_010980 [Xanthoria sp. 1 TBL-2021]|nr:MAG: hypothetical protein L6R42_010980 [Xanthoria sp. 1 TBL-2021]